MTRPAIAEACAQAERENKEAAGVLTGNDKLRGEGKTDQAVGKVKKAVQKVAD